MSGIIIRVKRIWEMLLRKMEHACPKLKKCWLDWWRSFENEEEEDWEGEDAREEDSKC